MKRLLAAAIAALISVGSAAAAQTTPADLVIRNATFIDVASGRAIAGRAIAIGGDTILAVGPDESVARSFAAKRSVDATGKFVIPGLWDMHVHFGGGPELIEENKALLVTDNTLKPDIFLYSVKAAKARGLKTSAHTPYALTIQQAA